MPTKKKAAKKVAPPPRPVAPNSTPRVAKFRADRAQAGITEVRGVFAPTEHHDTIKASARALAGSLLAKR